MSDISKEARQDIRWHAYGAQQCLRERRGVFCRLIDCSVKHACLPGLDPRCLSPQRVRLNVEGLSLVAISC